MDCYGLLTVTDSHVLVHIQKQDWCNVVGIALNTKPPQKNTIDQVTTTLATSKNVLFSGHNHLLITGTDDPTLLPELQQVKGHQYHWLAGGYNPEIGHF